MIRVKRTSDGDYQFEKGAVNLRFKDGLVALGVLGVVPIVMYLTGTVQSTAIGVAVGLFCFGTLARAWYEPHWYRYTQGVLPVATIAAVADEVKGSSEWVVLSLRTEYKVRRDARRFRRL